jgi:hypothetical protein
MDRRTLGSGPEWAAEDLYAEVGRRVRAYEHAKKLTGRALAVQMAVSKDAAPSPQTPCLHSLPVCCQRLRCHLVT